MADLTSHTEIELYQLQGEVSGEFARRNALAQTPALIRDMATSYLSYGGDGQALRDALNQALGEA